MSIKINHHYVSQFYLTAWSECGEAVFTSIENSRKMNIKKIASSNHYYKITNMDENTRDVLIRVVEKLKIPDLRDVFNVIINMMFIIDELKSSPNYVNHKELEDSEKEIKSNTIEKYYEIIEDLAALEFKKIIEQNETNTDINGYQNIIRYVIHQLTRTNKTRKLSKENYSEIFKENNIDFKSFDIFQSLVIAEQIVLSLIEKLYKITIIENKTAVNFITSDHPAINLNSIDTIEVKIYIPISPKKALIIEPSGIPQSDAPTLKERILSGKEDPKYLFDTMEISSLEVKELNEKTWINKGMHIYGYATEDIETFTRPPK